MAFPTTDDTQLYISVESSNVDVALNRLTHCSVAVKHWFLLNDLQLNADKSNAIKLGTGAQLRSAAVLANSVDVAGCSLP